VESNVIIGVLFAKGRVGNIGSEGCEKAGQKHRPFVPESDCRQFNLCVEVIFQAE
jgi:hypothetical protein